jgi:hypothetical protein
MGNMSVVRDLVTDMSDFWNKVRATTPWLVNAGDGPEGDVPADGREHLISPEEQAKITKESLCIMCGCCVSECNSMEADPAFMGPAALAKGYRFVGDVRDDATRERLEHLNGEHGVWDCTRCYFCNERCLAIHAHAARPAHRHTTALAVGQRTIARVLDVVQYIEERCLLVHVDLEVLEGTVDRPVLLRRLAPDLQLHQHRGIPLA